MFTECFTPHGDKLKALLNNNNLPESDKPRVANAIAQYSQWVQALRSVSGTGGIFLSSLVTRLNAYKNFIDVDLIYDSKENFLYRQNGQLKLSNSILEEFLPYLLDKRLVPGIENAKNLICGPSSSYAGLSFGSPLLNIGDPGAVFLKIKDQDFSIAKSHCITVTDNPAGDSKYSRKFFVSHFAAEIKTNLDKTMFQEASQTANELKRAVPGSFYLLLCEYLDMTPITTKLTSIDEVIVLRKSKRLPANVRAKFSTQAGRKNFRTDYVKFLEANSLHVDSFMRFVKHLNDCFPQRENDTEDTILKRGYF